MPPRKRPLRKSALGIINVNAGGGGPSASNAATAAANAFVGAGRIVGGGSLVRRIWLCIQHYTRQTALSMSQHRLHFRFDLTVVQAALLSLSVSLMLWGAIMNGSIQKQLVQEPSQHLRGDTHILPATVTVMVTQTQTHQAGGLVPGLGSSSSSQSSRPKNRPYETADAHLHQEICHLLHAVEVRDLSAAAAAILSKSSTPSFSPSSPNDDEKDDRYQHKYNSAGTTGLPDLCQFAARYHCDPRLVEERGGGLRRTRGSERSGRSGQPGHEENEGGDGDSSDKETLAKSTLPSDDAAIAMRTKLLLRSSDYVQPGEFDAACGPLSLDALLDAAGSNNEDDAGHRQRQRQRQQRRDQTQNLLARIQDLFRIPRAQALYDALYYGGKTGYLEVCPDFLD